MADKKIYTKNEIEAVKEGLVHYFPFEAGFSAQPIVVDDKWSDSARIFRWVGRDDYFTTLSEITKIQKLSDIKAASGILEKRGIEAPEKVEFKGAPESSAQANLPGKATRGEQEKLRVETEAKLKASEENQKRAVEEGIKRQQEIYAEKIRKTKAAEVELKKQKLYYEVEENNIEETQEVKNLRQQAEAGGKKFIKDAANQFESNPNLKNSAANEAKIAAEQAGVTTYDVLTQNPDSVSFQATIVNNIISNPELFKKVAPNPETQEVLRNIEQILTDSKTTQSELANQLTDLSKIKGSSLNIKFFDSPGPGRNELDFSQITSQHIDFLNQQSSLLNNLGNFSEHEIRSQILLGIGNRLESYVAKLPVNSLLAKTYNSDVVQLSLNSLGVVKTAPWVAAEGSLFGKIAVGSGFGPLAGFLQKATGLNLGVKLAEKGAQVGAEAAVSGGTKVGLTAALTPLFAWAGPAAPILAGIASWIASSAVVKGITNILSGIQRFLKENNLAELAPAALFGGLFIPFFGAGTGIGVGATIFGGLKFWNSTPAGRAAFGRGVGNFFGALGSATLVTIGTPILVTLLVFPVIVALILFIINSGAYIVPPSPFGGPGTFTSPYIDVAKTANPAGPFKNSDLPKTITYNVTVKAKKSALRNIKITDDCQVISKTVSKCPDFSLPTDKPDTIDPSKSYSFTYTVNYGPEFADTAIINTITVTADAFEQRGATVTGSSSVSFGTPPITCPVIGGHVSPNGGALLNYSYNGANNTGHGSQRYWQAMHEGPSSYPLPQSTDCFSPKACSYYGYAYDVFPSSSTDVFAPTVLGKSVTWSCSYAFSNGLGKQGYTFHCMSSDGNEMLVLTHMAKNAKTGTVNSGEKIGSLYNQGGNTHLHIEFQLNGRYVKPETYFCGGK